MLVSLGKGPSPQRRVLVGSLSCRQGSAAPKRHRFCCDHSTGCRESRAIIVAGVSETSHSVPGVSVLKPRTSPLRLLLSFPQGWADFRGVLRVPLSPRLPRQDPLDAPLQGLSQAPGTHSGAWESHRLPLSCLPGQWVPLAPTWALPDWLREWGPGHPSTQLTLKPTLVGLLLPCPFLLLPISFQLGDHHN